MRVKELMTENPVTAASGEHLATAVMQMRSRDCGVLPVVDHGKLAGVITDRDIAFALGMSESRPTSLTVGEVMNGELYACDPDDEVTRALDLMAAHRVRRLVVMDEGKLVGVLSLDDVVLAAVPEAGNTGRPTYAEVMRAMIDICAPSARAVMI